MNKNDGDNIYVKILISGHMTQLGFLVALLHLWMETDSHFSWQTVRYSYLRRMKRMKATRRAAKEMQ